MVQRQQNILSAISKVSSLEEELSYHLKNQTEITDELTLYELNELIALASKPSDKDTVSLSKYRKATERWRTKS